MDGYWCTSLLPTRYLINLVRLIRYLITVNLNWQYYCTYLDFASAVLPPLPRSKHVSLSKYYLENMKFRCCNCSAVLGLSTSIIWAGELDIDELNCKGAVSKCVSVYLARITVMNSMQILICVCLCPSQLLWYLDSVSLPSPSTSVSPDICMTVDTQQVFPCPWLLIFIMAPSAY